MRHAPLLPLLLLVLGCSAGDLEDRPSLGQHTSVRIDEDLPTCRDCKVELREVALLGSASNPASVSEEASGRPCMVGQLSTGEYVVSGISGGGEIFVYGPEGRVVRTFGSSGEGPGELSDRVRVAVGQVDTLYIYDGPQARLSVFTAGGDFVRSFPVPNQVRVFALLDNGRLLFSRARSDPEDALFFLTSLDGDDLGQFGKGFPVAPILDEHIVAPAYPKGFWTASIWRYEMHRWTAPDTCEESITREVDWFPHDGEYVEGMPFSIPTVPTLSHIWDDGQGRVWVYSIVADPAWEPGIPLNPRHEWTRRNFDTVLEVIDIQERRVIVSDRYDQILGMVCGSPLVYTVVEAEGGDTRIRVMEPRIVGLLE